ncbi:IclR family transcriptional regulator [Streptosporangium lutulentum]|nr:IclR family transcriptional regulator [Streptosporangium lutulentum]
MEAVDRPGLEIIWKADSLVRVLSRDGESTVAQLAEAVNEPLSSTYRLLADLKQIGWVERGSKRGLYRLGLFFVRIGGLAEEFVDVRERAIPHLRELRAEIGATAYLCVRRGLTGVCIERLEGPDVRALNFRVGDSLMLNVGGAPKALLAHLPLEERLFVKAGLAAFPGGPRGPLGRDLEDEIEQIRARGWAESDGDVTVGIAAIGAPVFNHRGEIEAAVSIGGLRSRVLDVPENGPRVAACAAAVSRSLGFGSEEVV